MEEDDAGENARDEDGFTLDDNADIEADERTLAGDVDDTRRRDVFEVRFAEDLVFNIGEKGK